VRLSHQNKYHVHTYIQTELLRIRAVYQRQPIMDGYKDYRSAVAELASYHGSQVSICDEAKIKSYFQLLKLYIKKHTATRSSPMLKGSLERPVPRLDPPLQISLKYTKCIWSILGIRRKVGDILRKRYNEEPNCRCGRTKIEQSSRRRLSTMRPTVS